MKSFKLTALSGALLAAGSMFAGTASAALTGTQTATVNFQGMGLATYGWANTAGGTNTVTGGGSFNQNGVMVGVVQDPTDPGAHYHQAGTAADRELQYHPDSTGAYVRLADKTNFSLQSIFLNTANSPDKGGNFVIYGFKDAINSPLLGTGSVDPNSLDYVLDNADPEGGLIPHIAEYRVANDGSSQTLTLAQLTATDADWGNIGAFWITMEGFNNSPTTHYWYDQTVAAPVSPYPSWDLRVDDIVLGAAVQQPAAVPVPGAVWLFGTGLAGFIASKRKKPTV